MVTSLQAHKFKIAYKSSWKDFHKERNHPGVHIGSLMRSLGLYSHADMITFLNSIKTELSFSYQTDKHDGYAVNIEGVGPVKFIIWSEGNE